MKNVKKGKKGSSIDGRFCMFSMWRKLVTFKEYARSVCGAKKCDMDEHTHRERERYKVCYRKQVSVEDSNLSKQE